MRTMQILQCQSFSCHDMILVPGLLEQVGFHGVMVSTLDSESSDPSSNLGGTWTPWRNGSASDSRSEGCVFESRRGHQNFFSLEKFFFCLQ